MGVLIASNDGTNVSFICLTRWSNIKCPLSVTLSSTSFHRSQAMAKAVYNLSSPSWVGSCSSLLLIPTLQSALLSFWKFSVKWLLHCLQSQVKWQAQHNWRNGLYWIDLLFGDELWRFLLAFLCCFDLDHSRAPRGKGTLSSLIMRLLPTSS
jgi:hypothetical protein